MGGAGGSGGLHLHSSSVCVVTCPTLRGGGMCGPPGQWSLKSGLRGCQVEKKLLVPKVTRTGSLTALSEVVPCELLITT